MNSTDAMLEGVRFVPSPNRDARPAGCVPELVVLHGISLPPGEFGGPWVEALFTNRLDPAAHPYFAAIAGLRVSCHLFLRRDGDLVQFVPFSARAWHAGDSAFGGRRRCNDFSIGIELEGDDGTPYAAVQYARLEALIPALMRAYPAIAPERVVGHCHIAPHRKTDPGPAFDWARLEARLGVPQPRVEALPEIGA